MADYGVEVPMDYQQNGGAEDEVMYNEEQQYNDYGAEEGNAMDIDDVPVTQEDAWAVIS